MKKKKFPKHYSHNFGGEFRYFNLTEFLSFVLNVLIFFWFYVFYLEVHRSSKPNSKAHNATESNLFQKQMLLILCKIIYKPTEKLICKPLRW